MSQRTFDARMTPEGEVILKSLLSGALPEASNFESGYRAGVTATREETREHVNQLNACWEGDAKRETRRAEHFAKQNVRLRQIILLLGSVIVLGLFSLAGWWRFHG